MYLGGSISTLALSRAIAFYEERFAKLLSPTVTVVQTLLDALVVESLRGWLDLSVICSNVYTEISVDLERVSVDAKNA